MTDLRVFSRPEFGEVRSLMRDGEPWFVGKDVAAALGYAKPTDEVRKLVDADDRGISKLETPSGVQEMVIINESGLYSLIMSSKLPSAKAFKRWVTSEVLPSIRKTGSYGRPSVGEMAELLKQLNRSKGADHDVAIAMIRQAGFDIPDASYGSHPALARYRNRDMERDTVAEFLNDFLPQIQYSTLIPFGVLHGQFDIWASSQNRRVRVSRSVFVELLEMCLPMHGWELPRRGMDGKYIKVRAKGRLDGRDRIFAVLRYQSDSYRGIVKRMAAGRRCRRH